MKNSQKEEKIQKIKNLFIHETEFKKIIEKISNNLKKEESNAK